MKPTTGPITSSMPGGPCSAGTAVMSTRPTERCDQSAMPTQGAPRSSPAFGVLSTSGRRHRELGASDVEVVGVLVVRGEHHIDLPELVGLQRRARGS